MSLIKEGIDKVRAVELPAGYLGCGDCFAAVRQALVEWHCNFTDKFFQVYVNGRYAGSTVSPGQRQMVVPVPSSPVTAVSIEVFAVEPRFACVDFSDEVSSGVDAGRVRLKLLRSQELPLGSVVQIYFDSGTGDIDYGNPLNAEPIRVWPCRYDKAGFGMSCFGEGDFGFDSQAAVGFGLGDFARGQFGLDADSIEWISEPLSRGTYKFAAVLTDENGDESEPVVTEPITVIPSARPAKELSILSFDKEVNELVLGMN